MGEKIYGEGLVNFVITIVESLEKNGDLPDFLRILAEKGYLDKKEETPKGIADEEWGVRSAHRDDPPYCVYRKADWYGRHIAARIPTRELADAIAALPELVKAAREMCLRINRMGTVSAMKGNIAHANSQLQEALEKAGEKL